MLSSVSRKIFIPAEKNNPAVNTSTLMNDDFPVWAKQHNINFNNGPPSLSEYVTLITNSCLGLIDVMCRHLINKVLLPALPQRPGSSFQ